MSWVLVLMPENIAGVQVGSLWFEEFPSSHVATLHNSHPKYISPNQQPVIQVLHPRKLTWNQRMLTWKKKSIYKPSIFGFKISNSGHSRQHEGINKVDGISTRQCLGGRSRCASRGNLRAAPWKFNSKSPWDGLWPREKDTNLSKVPNGRGYVGDPQDLKDIWPGKIRDY